MKKITKKLALQSQTLRVLEKQELGEVGGAWGVYTVWCIPTINHCPQSGSPMCNIVTGK
ncbi:MAG TPA: hypothetical protein VIU61_04335 [Kofleriaceae bacterium]